MKITRNWELWEIVQFIIVCLGIVISTLLLLFVIAVAVVALLN